MKIASRVSLAVALGATWLAGATRAQMPTPGLLFHAVTPCRVFDTRLGPNAPAPLMPGNTRHFRVAGSALFEHQGGNAGGCGIPGDQGTLAPRVRAVMLNFIAVNPSGPGNLQAWSSDGDLPQTSIINFTTATTVANGIAVAISEDEGSVAVRANASATHAVADVLGYFVAPAMGSRTACYTSSCAGISLDSGSNYIWGNGNGRASNIPDLVTATRQTCLVTAHVSLFTDAAPQGGHATVRTALRDTTTGTNLSEAGVANWASFLYGTGDRSGSASKTNAWALEANKEYRFGCVVDASGDYVGGHARCHVSWICR